MDNPNDPAVQHPDIQLVIGTPDLNDTAWRTVQTTGALAYMPYDEAQRYTAIYKIQSQMTQLSTENSAEDLAAFYGLREQYRWREKKLTAEQAGEAVRLLGRAKLHFKTEDRLLHYCAEFDSAFLENRKPMDINVD
jgi:hypothetical protein